jgi:hypothetical protein
VCDPLLDTLAACTLTVHPGDNVALSGVALDAAGRIIVGVPLTWTTDNILAAQLVTGPAVETVLTAQAEPGTARVAATTGTVSSPTLTVNNMGPPAAAKIRVKVVSAATGVAVATAEVVVNDAQAPTGADGVVEFETAALPQPWTLSVFHAQYDYASFFGLYANVDGALDATVHLTPAQPLQTSAGLQGTVDISAATSAGPVSLALAGVSAADVSSLSFSKLLGDTFFVDVELPFVGAQAIPLPGGITLSAEIPLLGPQELKTTFDALGSGGRRIAWTFGGRMAFGALQGLLGLTDPVSAVMLLVRDFQGLTHGLSTGYLLVELPYVRDGDTDFDGVSDVDRDGDSNEMIPDYLAFPQASLTVRQEQTLRVSVILDSFPAGAGGGGALVTAGAQVPGHGFVPLGMTSVTPDEAQDPLSLKLAPRYGGLEGGQYVVAAFVFGVSLAGNAPSDMSMRTARAETLPTDVELGAFLDFPTGSSFRSATTSTNPQVTLSGVSGADVHRATLGDSSGQWRVYAPGGGGTQVLDLPAPPVGLPARDDVGVSVEALQLQPDFQSGGPDQMGALLTQGAAGQLDALAVGLSRGIFE